MQDDLYRQMYELEDRHWWFLGRRRIVESVISRIGLSPEAAVLDAGCGTGGNLAMLARFGAVVGTELDAAAAGMARTRAMARIVRAKLPLDMPFEPGLFHLATLLDVLEHIEDDGACLRTLESLLRPGGHLVLTVPAFPFLWGAHDIEHRHVRRYRAGPLRGLLESSGLKVEWISYYNTLLFPLVAVARLARKMLPVTGTTGPVGRELALPPKPVNALLEGIFACERHWLGRVRAPVGVSLIAVARKP